MYVHLNDLNVYVDSVISLMQSSLPILLFGPMGVGKSTLVRTLLKKQIPNLGHVPSPSFPIMIPYQGPMGSVWHVDLYRLNGHQDIKPLGLEELMCNEICLIEWPERLGPLMPRKHVWISMNFVDAMPGDACSSLWRDISMGQKIDG